MLTLQSYEQTEHHQAVQHERHHPLPTRNAQQMSISNQPKSAHSFTLQATETTTINSAKEMKRQINVFFILTTLAILAVLSLTLVVRLLII